MHGSEFNHTGRKRPRIRSARAGSFCCAIEPMEQRILLTSAPPAIPTNLVATPQSATPQIQLAWTDNSTNEIAFAIERSFDAASYVQVATVDANVTTFLDSPGVVDTLVFYRIRALGQGVNSPFTDAVHSQLAAAHIFGQVFNDVNHNGIFDPTESGLAGRPVYRDDDNSGTLNNGESFSVTDSQGNYGFTGLLAGNYLLRLVSPAGMVQSAPAAGMYDIALQTGQVLGGQDFGVYTPAAFTFGGSIGNDNYLVHRNGQGFIEVVANTSGSAQHAYIYGGAPVLLFDPGEGDDTITIDFTTGDPVPTGGIAFVGGGGIDTINVMGKGPADPIALSATEITRGLAFVGFRRAENLGVSNGAFAAAGDLGGLSLAVGSAASVRFNSSQHLARLDIAAGSAATETSNGGHFLRLGAVSIADSGKLDLMDNDLIVDYDPAAATPLGSIDSLLTGGYGAAKNWTGGHGITSTLGNAGKLTLGAAEASAIFKTFPATFDGESMDSSTVLVKFTHYADANLDGKTDFGDLGIILNHFNQKGNWSAGDTNRDGRVDFGDLGFLLNNFSPTGPILDPENATPVTAALSDTTTVAVAQAPGATPSTTQQSTKLLLAKPASAHRPPVRKKSSFLADSPRIFR